MYEIRYTHIRNLPRGLLEMTIFSLRVGGNQFALIWLVVNLIALNDWLRPNHSLLSPGSISHTNTTLLLLVAGLLGFCVNADSNYELTID